MNGEKTLFPARRIFIGFNDEDARLLATNNSCLRTSCAWESESKRLGKRKKRKGSLVCFTTRPISVKGPVSVTGYVRVNALAGLTCVSPTFGRKGQWSRVDSFSWSYQRMRAGIYMSPWTPCQASLPAASRNNHDYGMVKVPGSSSCSAVSSRQDDLTIWLTQ